MASALASAARFTRASWLRDSAAYLNRALVHPNASFFLFSHGRPLVRRTEPGRLASFPWPAVAPTVLHSVRLIAPDAQDVFGPEAYGLEKHPDADSRWWNDNTQGIISPTLSLTFLGIREDGTPPQSLTDGERQLVVPSGTPTFALSLSHHPQGEPVPPAHELARALADDYEALDMRAINMGGALNPSETAIVAYARSLLDWNDRYRFCTGCGSRQYSIWAGHKRGCASSLAARTAASSPFVRAVHPTYASAQPCASTQSLQNYSYPRTDPAVVIGIISADGDHILLGRQKNFPKGLYSCISGFVEFGETLEDAVRREALEETGVDVGKVVYHTSLPFPMPANLLIGAFAFAEHSRVRCDLDAELEDAFFAPRADVLAAVRVSETGSGSAPMRNGAPY